MGTLRDVDFEVAIAGGGPAGLQCALLLGRARRSVIVIDSGEPRNGVAREAHGLFSRDGITPDALLSSAREQLRRYSNVETMRARVTSAHGGERGWTLLTEGGERVEAERLVIATGMRDRLPEIAGLRECWGSSAFVCPYCDGWEVRDRAIAAWGNTRSGTALAQELRQWSHDVLVCSDLHTPLAPGEREWLRANDVPVREASIVRLHERDGILREIEFDDGERVAREALFLSVTLEQSSPLAESIGCRITERGHVDVDTEYRASVPGVYAIGDCVTHMHQIVFAAASGARAAIAINNELTNLTL